jgi:bifunctional non-homologous end joining protein LigD
LELTSVSPIEARIQIDRVEGLVAVAQIAGSSWSWVVNRAIRRQPAVSCSISIRLFFDRVIEAPWPRDRLKALGLASFCKTTGSKASRGPPVVRRRKTNPGPKQKHSPRICVQMAADNPTRYLVNAAEAARRPHLLDYLRTTRCRRRGAFSPRARAGAPVSIPLTQGQKGLDPRLHSVGARTDRKGYVDAHCSPNAPRGDNNLSRKSDCATSSTRAMSRLHCR